MVLPLFCYYTNYADYFNYLHYGIYVLFTYIWQLFLMMKMMILDAFLKKCVEHLFLPADRSRFDVHGALLDDAGGRFSRAGGRFAAGQASNHQPLLQTGQ
jgi:hypothetical protein